MGTEAGEQPLRPRNMEQCPCRAPGLLIATDAGPSITDAGQWSLPAGPLSPSPLKLNVSATSFVMFHLCHTTCFWISGAWVTSPHKAGGATGNMNFYLIEPWTYDMGNSPNSKVISGSRHPKSWQRVTTLFYFTFQKINNTQVDHLHSSVLLTMISCTAHNWLAYTPQGILPNIWTP